LKTVSIQVGQSRYEAHVGDGLLSECGPLIAARLSRGRCVIVADQHTAPHFGEIVAMSLRAAGYTPVVLTVPAGEGAKSLDQAGLLCDQITAAGLDRTSFLIALGGGVIGDLAGFAAAIYHRGIAYVQIPTTLLAQVDSAIGGKTGVNTTSGKNLLGAVHQPALVIADVATLKTLPAREMKQGFAEIIKHAVVADASLFDVLPNFAPPNATNALEELVARNIAIKAAIVARDETDVSGERAVLNFGHTVGHAIERASEGGFLHGEAISLGIATACEISVRKAGLAEKQRLRVVTTLNAFDLPTKLPADFPREKILPFVQSDKKFEGGAVRFVVTPGLGSARLSDDVSLADIEAAIELL
jgi:3-dehydroquinate synthase